MLLSLVLGALVGAVFGLTGAGGGILAVPALVVGLGWSMQQVAPFALVAVARGAGIGARRLSSQADREFDRAHAYLGEFDG